PPTPEACIMADILQERLTKPQLDLLALFQRTNLSDDDWLEIRRLITRYLAQRATEAADEAVAAKGWTSEDLDRLARGHQRYTP
ncbi:MAG: hypothetical protein AAF730_17130, partial [Bacteroidota bacterium]